MVYKLKQHKIRKSQFGREPVPSRTPEEPPCHPPPGQRDPGLPRGPFPYKVPSAGKRRLLPPDPRASRRTKSPSFPSNLLPPIPPAPEAEAAQSVPSSAASWDLGHHPPGAGQASLSVGRPRGHVSSLKICHLFPCEEFAKEKDKRIKTSQRASSMSKAGGGFFKLSCHHFSMTQIQKSDKVGIVLQVSEFCFA